MNKDQIGYKKQKGKTPLKFSNKKREKMEGKEKYSSEPNSSTMNTYLATKKRIKNFSNATTEGNI